MTLKETKYEEVEYEDENEFVIGAVLFLEGKVCYAKVHEDIIGDKSSIEKVEEFLETVKKLEWIRL